jgi:predicted TIM-barrel fold metal-dependent hydrolase
VGLVGTDELAEACSEAHQVIESGVSAVLVPEGRLLGGLSPADPKVDRFWSIFAEANIPVLIHVGGGLDYPSSAQWGETEILQAGGAGTGEVVSPYLLGVLQHAAENYIVTLTLGGVFERISNLRFGAIELGASWFGPMAERMEMIVEMGLGKEIRKFPLRPSEYLRRNVRVTPFVVEDIGRMIERYGLEESYAFSTDFPHPEGGKDPLQRMTKSIDRHGRETLEKFLVTNSELLMPA